MAERMSLMLEKEVVVTVEDDRREDEPWRKRNGVERECQSRRRWEQLARRARL